jgi:hypothetical protein
MLYPPTSQLLLLHEPPATRPVYEIAPAPAPRRRRLRLPGLTPAPRPSAEPASSPGRPAPANRLPG